MSECGILHWQGMYASPKDADGCVLPDIHDGPHLFIDEDGVEWCWETDWSCECEHCMSAEGDYCTIYWKK
jgi:hypothetical protein